MIDIHCHILPDIDDGPDNFEESVAMARVAEADGIKTIVATPHVNNQVYPQAEVSRRVSWLRHLLRQEGIAVQILAGGDVSSAFAADQVRGFTINGSDYILLEFPHTHLPGNAAEILFHFRLVGLRPVITHPERNPSIAQNPQLLFKLLQDGVYVQLTAGSLVGDFGDEARYCGLELLQRNVVDVLASDGHSSSWRKPVLSKGVKAAARIVGKEAAQKMVAEIPEKIINNQPI